MRRVRLGQTKDCHQRACTPFYPLGNAMQVLFDQPHEEDWKGVKMAAISPVVLAPRCIALSGRWNDRWGSSLFLLELTQKPGQTPAAGIVDRHGARW